MTVHILCGLSSERKLIWNMLVERKKGKQGFLCIKHSSVIRMIKAIYNEITAFQILPTS